MEETLALTGQEAMPEVNQTQPSQPEDRPSGNNPSMESLLEEGMTLDLPKPGEIRTGVIARISDSEILISIGAKSEGIINGKEKDAIPRDEFAKFEVGQEIPVYVLCHHGNRSMQVTGWLIQQGFKNVINVSGGIDAYARAVDSSVGFY